MNLEAKIELHFWQNTAASEYVESMKAEFSNDELLERFLYFAALVYHPFSPIHDKMRSFDDILEIAAEKAELDPGSATILKAVNGKIQGVEAFFVWLWKKAQPKIGFPDYMAYTKAAYTLRRILHSDTGSAKALKEAAEGLFEISRLQALSFKEIGLRRHANLETIEEEVEKIEARKAGVSSPEQFSIKPDYD